MLKQCVSYSLQFGLILLFLSGCNTKELERLRAQNDSLRTNITDNHKAVKDIQEISVLIDSVDAMRNVLRVEMLEGIPYKDYSERMEQVLAYVDQSKTKIQELQEKFEKLSDSTNGYLMMIDALNGELVIATEQIEDLKLQVEKAEAKNTELMTIVKVQKTTIDDNQAKIKQSKKEITTNEARIAELAAKSQLYESELYYTKAEAAYEQAKQTKLAPRKKKDIMKEALELYKKASALGNKQAPAKITELESKI
jgi:chromosome segregation ATPase